MLNILTHEFMIFYSKFDFFHSVLLISNTLNLWKKFIKDDFFIYFTVTKTI